MTILEIERELEAARRTITDLERQVISLRKQLADEEQSSRAEFHRITAELNFPLGGATMEAVIAEIRRLVKANPCYPEHVTEPRCTRTDPDHVRRFHRGQIG